MLNTDAVEYKSRTNKPPYEEFDADIFASVDQNFPLIDFSVVFSSSNGWIIEIGDLIRPYPIENPNTSMIEIHTPKTTSLPLIAFLRDSLLQRSPLTTSTPRDANFLEASESGLRVIARGVNVLSASTDSRTADPA